MFTLLKRKYNNYQEKYYLNQENTFKIPGTLISNMYKDLAPTILYL